MQCRQAADQACWRNTYFQQRLSVSLKVSNGTNRNSQRPRKPPFPEYPQVWRTALPFNEMNTPKLLLFALSAVATSNAFWGRATPSEIVRYMKEQGTVIGHHVHRSESFGQMLVSFCVDENLKGDTNVGASNPANVHCEMALFKNEVEMGECGSGFHWTRLCSEL